MVEESNFSSKPKKFVSEKDGPFFSESSKTGFFGVKF